MKISSKASTLGIILLLALIAFGLYTTKAAGPTREPRRRTPNISIPHRSPPVIHSAIHSSALNPLPFAGRPK
jgi:hypothetical protein